MDRRRSEVPNQRSPLGKENFYKGLRSCRGDSDFPIIQKNKNSLLSSLRSYLKPYLTERYKKLSFDFVIKSLILEKNQQGNNNFSNMDHVVHVDEKRFFIDLSKKNLITFKKKCILRDTAPGGTYLR